jgi:hypothetical protein
VRTLVECLTDYPLPLLRGIAETRTIVLTANEQRQITEQLTAALGEPMSVSVAVNSLTQSGKAALARLVAAGGRMTAAAFARLAGEVRPFGTGKLPREQPWSSPINAAEELWYRALIGRAFTNTERGAVEYIFVPSDILPLLPQLPAMVPATVVLVPASGEPAHVMAPSLLLADIGTLLAFIQNESPRLHPLVTTAAIIPSFSTDLGYWRERDVERLRILLHEPASLPLMVTLVEQMGCSKRERDRLHLDIPSTRSWLEQSPQEQQRILFASWRAAATWNDLQHVPGLRYVPTGWRNDPLLARQAILHHLCRCVAGWYTLAGFIVAIQQNDPDFQRPDGDYQSWYIQDEVSGRFLRGFEDWPGVEGALIRYLLTGPLHWLDLVELGTPAQDEKEPACFRLTPLGTWLLELAAKPLPTAALPVQVHEDFSITVPHTARLADRFRVARLAMPVTPLTTGSSGDQFRLTRESLARARRQGWTPERVLAFLQVASQGDIPQRVAAALMRSGEHSVRLRHLVVLQADPSHIRAIRARPEVAGFLREPLSDSTLVVDERKLAALQAALRACGYTISEEPVPPVRPVQNRNH